MEYEFTPEEQTFLDAFIAAVAAHVSSVNHDVRDSCPDRQRLLEAAGALAATGYLAVTDPGPAMVAAAETLAQASPSLCLALETSARVFGRLVNTWGTDDQIDRWTAPIAAGRALGTLALSETAMNVENEPLKTVAVTDGDGVVINGDKSGVVNAAEADWIAVAGMVDDRGAIFVIDADNPGLKIGPRRNAAGYDGAAFTDLSLTDCRIPADAVIGPLDDRPMRDMLCCWENQLLCGISLGLMKTAFESARDHAKTHHSGGRPVIAYQSVGFKLAEMMTLHQTAQWLAMRAAWARTAGKPDADMLNLCAKVFCGESADQVTGSALQILSGAGYLDDHPVTHARRCATYIQIAGTSTEIARVKLGDDAMGWK